MKKFLSTLILGSGLAFNSVALEAQEPKKKYEYEILLDEFIKVGIGSVKYVNDTLSLNIRDKDKTYFFMNGNDYVEVAESSIKRDEYRYKKENDSWRFENYNVDFFTNKKDENLMRKIENRFDLEGKVFSDVFPAINIFSEFEGNKIPDTLSILAFSCNYKFSKKSVNKKENQYIVDYEPINICVEASDKKYLKGDIQIILEKEDDKTFVPVGAKGKMGYLTIFGEMELNLLVRKK